jgi:hypothetical protein
VKCNWAGPVRTDFAMALADAVQHLNVGEHVATIEYLPAVRGGSRDECFPTFRDESNEGTIERFPGTPPRQKAISLP